MTTAETGEHTDTRQSKAFFFNQALDFFFLGGGSLPVLCLLLLLPPDEYKIYVLAMVMLMTVFINHPHFIHSYQIFYAGFREKAAPKAILRWRYLLAGIVVPVALIVFFLWCILTVDGPLMGKAANAMLFLVGWHYAKQGYGILIVESVLKRAFFTDKEKLCLRINALIVWLTSWMFLNRILIEQEVYGLSYFTLGVPQPLFETMQMICFTASVFTAAMLLRKAMTKRLPINGLLAYITSSYVWLLLAPVNPLAALVIPAFHSLQYLAVVWRYQLNKSEAQPKSDGRLLGGLIVTTPAKATTIHFVAFGTFVGIVVFFALPFALDMALAYREEVFGGTMFLFTFVVFINVHHYFMDNVIWRRDNPDIKEHLFS